MRYLAALAVLLFTQVGYSAPPEDQCDPNTYAVQGHRGCRQARSGPNMPGVGGGGGGGGGPTAINNTKSIQFDGVNEFCQVADSDELECDDENEFTYCAWVYLDVAATTKTILGKEDYSTDRTFYLTSLGVSGTHWILYAIMDSNDTNCAHSGFAWIIGGYMDQARWYHVCGVWDGAGATNTDRLKVYINGNEAYQGETGTIPDDVLDCDSSFDIGVHDGLGRYWGTGNIDQVVQWCDAKSGADIYTLYNDGTPAHPDDVDSDYRIYLPIGDDDGAGDDETTMANSGTSADLTCTNVEAGDYVEEVPTGTFSDTNSLALDGVDEFVSITDHDTLECDDEDEVTACVWVKNIRSRNNKAFIAKGSVSSESWELETRVCTSNTSCQIMFRIQGAHVRTDTEVMLEDTWYLLCGVYDGDAAGGTNLDKAKIYLNGSSVADNSSGTIPTTMNNGATPFTVGQWDGGTRYKDSVFSEAYFWCDALSDAQMTTLYNSGTPLNPASVQANQRVWLRFGDEPGDSASGFDNLGLWRIGTGVTSATNLEAGDIGTDVP